MYESDHLSPQHALLFGSNIINQLWFSTVQLACCKTFAICCTGLSIYKSVTCKLSFLPYTCREHFSHTHAGCNCLHRHSWLSVWLSHIHFVHVEAETVQPSILQELQLHTRRRQQITPGNGFITTNYQCQHECCLWV